MRSIESVQNPAIQDLKALKTASGRRDQRLFWVEGDKLVREALRDATVYTLLVDAARAHEFENAKANVISVPTRILEAVCDTKTPQGVGAAVNFPPTLMLSPVQGALLALDEVQDPGNVGTMIRTAEAMGFCGVLLSEDAADPFSPKAVRASMGSIFRVPVYRGSLFFAIPQLKAQGYTVYGATLDGQLDFIIQNPPLLVIGSEGHGISPGVMTLCDEAVSIQMHGRAESLNAAVAAGILMARFPY